jgi:hypothetical protein
MYVIEFTNSEQGCQMVGFQTKNSNLGKFWRATQWKILVYYMTVWYILRPLEIFYGRLVYFVAICYISPRFRNLYQEKSGNPDSESVFVFVLHKFVSGAGLPDGLFSNRKTQFWKILEGLM